MKYNIAVHSEKFYRQGRSGTETSHKQLEQHYSAAPV